MKITDFRVGDALPEHRSFAQNGAAHSENKIHDDTVARQYGFSGGLVPGVTVHAYMTRPLVTAFGRGWVERGTISTRFNKPFYEGGLVIARAFVTAVSEKGVEAELQALNEHEDICAVGTASLPAEAHEAPPPGEFPEASLPAMRPPATASILGEMNVMGSLTQTWDPGQNEAFLDEIEDDLPLWRGPKAVLHPGYLIRFANTILVRNVEMGPWIHVSSDVTHFRAIPTGVGFTTRGRVLETFERKGHKFAVLDVLVATDSGEPAMRARHTAIYEVRKLSNA